VEDDDDDDEEDDDDNEEDNDEEEGFFCGISQAMSSRFDKWRKTLSFTLFVVFNN